MRYVWILLLFTLLQGQAFAVQVEGLYSATVPVASQQREERNAAMQQAIGKVVRKISGAKVANNSPALQEELLDVGSYVEQFQYSKLEETVLLKVRFQKNAIDNVLERHGVSVWGSSRPTVLVWLAIEEKGRRYLVGEDETAQQLLLQQAASESGLPIMLPVLDIEDQRAVKFNDVRGLFVERVLDASARYNAKQVVIGRIRRDTSGEWRLNWILLNKQTQFESQARADSLEAVLDIGFASVAGHLIDIYAPKGQHVENEVELQIEGLADLSRFSRVAQYLSSLDRVKNLQWEHVELGQSRLKVIFMGPLEGLKQSIALGDVLTLQPSIAQEDIQWSPEHVGNQLESMLTPILHYRLKE